jgi:hypothetical protein
MLSPAQFQTSCQMQCIYLRMRVAFCCHTYHQGLHGLSDMLAKQTLLAALRLPCWMFHHIKAGGPDRQAAVVGSCSSGLALHDAVVDIVVTGLLAPDSCCGTGAPCGRHPATHVSAQRCSMARTAQLFFPS